VFTRRAQRPCAQTLARRAHLLWNLAIIRLTTNGPTPLPNESARYLGRIRKSHRRTCQCLAWPKRQNVTQHKQLEAPTPTPTPTLLRRIHHTHTHMHAPMHVWTHTNTYEKHVHGAEYGAAGLWCVDIQQHGLQVGTCYTGEHACMRTERARRMGGAQRLGLQTTTLAACHVQAYGQVDGQDTKHMSTSHQPAHASALACTYLRGRPLPRRTLGRSWWALRACCRC
jgi:hypothetical protein